MNTHRAATALAILGLLAALAHTAWRCGVPLIAELFDG